MRRPPCKWTRSMLDHVRVALCPGMTDAGVILMLTAAGGAG